MPLLHLNVSWLHMWVKQKQNDYSSKPILAPVLERVQLPQFHADDLMWIWVAYIHTAGSLLRQAVTETNVRPELAADHFLHRRLTKTVPDMSSCIFSNGWVNSVSSGGLERFCMVQWFGLALFNEPSSVSLSFLLKLEIDLVSETLRLVQNTRR